VVLTELWKRLSVENQQQTLTILSRVVANQLVETPVAKEVDDE
jgi:hypothetical protein